MEEERLTGARGLAGKRFSPLVGKPSAGRPA